MAKGFVPRAKAAYYGGLERLYPVPVVFHHVPKCGGSSVGRAFRRSYLASYVKLDEPAVHEAADAAVARGEFARSEVAADVFRRMTLAYHLAMRAGCVHGHVRYDPALHEAYADTYKFITVLRDPADRLVSAYYFDLGGKGRNGIEGDLSTFVRSERGQHWARIYTDYFGGVAAGEPPGGAASVEEAKRALSGLDVVGTMSDLKGFETRLREALGRRITIGHVNAGGKRARAGRQLSGEERALVEEACADDREVYEHALSLG